MPAKKKISRARMLAAISDTGGVVSSIARKLSYSWHATKAAIEADPLVMAAYEDECERINDIAESNIMKSIIGGDNDRSQWWLKTRRRTKFGDAVALTGADGKDLPAQIVKIYIPTNGRDDDKPAA